MLKESLRYNRFITFKKGYKRTLASKFISYSSWKKNCLLWKAIFIFPFVAYVIGFIVSDYWMGNVNPFMVLSYFLLFIFFFPVGLHFAKLEKNYGVKQLQVNDKFSLKFNWVYPSKEK